MGLNRFIYIQDKHYVTKKPMWKTLYKCYNCGNEELFEGFLYCPSCGIHLVWEISGDNDDDI